MEKENLKESLKLNDTTMNTLALEHLLQDGRVKLLDDKFYNQCLKKIEDDYNSGKGSFIMTKDYALEIIKSARKMALMESKDLYDFISREICVTQEVEQEVEKENDSPDYDY